MSTLSEILRRDINREIEGVIKADDARRIGQEIEEYVITKEVEKVLVRLFEGMAEAIDNRIKRLPDAYPYNGVWISGYFGSGKSHLLKILAHLMSNHTEESLKNTFLAKIDGEMLKGAVDTVFRTPATSVLFNIDQQADAETDDRSQVVLFVFEKVFNRALGYCDDDPIIADFERDLDERGELAPFMAHFEETTGKRWEDKRDGVATADRDLFETAWSTFKSVSTDEASAVLDRYETHRTLTAEQFAKRVKRWLDMQEDPNHRINFFADEVGQFVANHPDRMLNLQTVAETLATVCENRAWVFVTSQEDLDSVIGDANQEQRNDFSRITARFYFRLPLTSANVEEVIQKRLLDKTDSGRSALVEFYDTEKDHLKATFRFSTGAKEIRIDGADHFADSYPFLPYQFYYLQQALRGLSEHNAFMGRHVSRGERSMLEVFQDVGRQLADTELVRFATFDQMFDGIRNTLKGGLITQINLAEEQIPDDLSVRILKVLLMLKYVKDLPTTVDHLTILVAHSVDTDFPALRGAVQTAIDRLLEQSYIQRVEDRYEYLTDQEQDVEREIKAISVDYAEIRRSIGRVVLDRILKNNRFTYDANSQDYGFSLSVDSELYKQAKSDLSIQVVTHLNPAIDNLPNLLSASMGKKELLVVLDVNRKTDYELRLFEQTKIYLNHNTGGQDDLRQRILNDKRLQNSFRERTLREEAIPRLVENAGLYIDGREITSGVKDPRQRLIDALQDLVSVSYPSLRMLTETYTEARLQSILFPSDGDTLFSGDAIDLGEDESEVQGYLMIQQNQAKTVTVASLKEHFGHGQYGWYEWAVLGVLAKLYAREAIEMVEGSRVLDRRDALTRLQKAHGHDMIVVRIAQPIDSDLVNRVSRFFQEFFHRAPSKTAGKELTIELKNALIEERSALKALVTQSDRYPFLAILEDAIGTYDQLLKLEYLALASEISARYDDLLMEKLETVDRAKGFLNGPGRDTYERIDLYLRGNRDNFHQLGLTAELDKLEQYLVDPTPWAGNATKTAQDAYSAATQRITATIETAQQETLTAIDEALASVRSVPGFSALTETEQRTVLSPIDYALRDQVSHTRVIATIENISRIKLPEALETARAEVSKKSATGPEIVYADKKEKRIPFDKTELVTEDDVTAYAEAVKRHYGKIVGEGKRITI